jgi:hypothetical protein
VEIPAEHWVLLCGIKARLGKKESGTNTSLCLKILIKEAYKGFYIQTDSECYAVRFAIKVQNN